MSVDILDKCLGSMSLSYEPKSLSWWAHYDKPHLAVYRIYPLKAHCLFLIYVNEHSGKSKAQEFENMSLTSNTSLTSFTSLTSITSNNSDNSYFSSFNCNSPKQTSLSNSVTSPYNEYTTILLQNLPNPLGNRGFAALWRHPSIIPMAYLLMILTFRHQQQELLSW